MNRLFRYGVFATALALIVALVVPLAAQEVTPGEGGIIIEGNFGGDPATFNPLLASDTSSARVAGFMFPAWIGVNPETAVHEPGRPDALVTDWTISEDGLTYTFTLRDDWTWNDGTPMTSADILYSWEAIASGVVETSLSYQVDLIDSVTAPDANTIVVTFKAAACTNLTEASYWSPVPSHVSASAVTRVAGL